MEEVYVTPSTIVEYDLIEDPYAPDADTEIFSFDRPCTYLFPNADVTPETASATDNELTDGINSDVEGIVKFKLIDFVEPICVLPLYVLQPIVIVPDELDGKLLAILFGTVHEYDVPTPVANLVQEPDPIL